MKRKVLKGPLVLTIILLGLILSFASNLHSQDADQKETPPPNLPPPKFPLKLRAPQNATWTIESKGEGSSGAPDPNGPPLVRERIVYKTFPIYHEIANLENGKASEKWAIITPNQTYRFDKQGDHWQRLIESNLEDIPRYEVSDFEALAWMNEKNFSGVKMLNQQPVYFFEETSEMPITREDARSFDIGGYVAAKNGEEESAPTTSGKTYTCRAYLDAKTLLPVKFENGSHVYTYTYGEPPTSQLSLPPDLIEDIKKWNSEIKARNR